MNIEVKNGLTSVVRIVGMSAFKMCRNAFECTVRLVLTFT